MLYAILHTVGNSVGLLLGAGVGLWEGLGVGINVAKKIDKKNQIYQMDLKKKENANWMKVYVEPLLKFNSSQLFVVFFRLSEYN